MIRLRSAATAVLLSASLVGTGLVIGGPALAVSPAPAMGQDNPYANIQVGVGYTVYQPGFTAGFPQREVTTLDCAAGEDASVSATYSANKPRTQWYEGSYITLLEGNPICADGVLGQQIATAKINGAKATIYIGCGGGTESPCPRAPRSALRSVGGTLEVTFPGTGGRPATDIRMGFGGLNLGQALKVARSLAPVD